MAMVMAVFLLLQPLVHNGTNEEEESYPRPPPPPPSLPLCNKAPMAQLDMLFLKKKNGGGTLCNNAMAFFCVCFFSQLQGQTLF